MRVQRLLFQVAYLVTIISMGLLIHGCGGGGKKNPHQKRRMLCHRKPALCSRATGRRMMTTKR